MGKRKLQTVQKQGLDVGFGKNFPRNHVTVKFLMFSTSDQMPAATGHTAVWRAAVPYSACTSPESLHTAMER